MSQFKLTFWQRRRLLGQLRAATDVRTYRRTLAVLELDRGRSAAEIAVVLGMSRQSVYNWAAAFARDHSPKSLIDDPRSGRPRLLTEPTEPLLRSLRPQPSVIYRRKRSESRETKPATSEDSGIIEVGTRPHYSRQRRLSSETQCPQHAPPTQAQNPPPPRPNRPGAERERPMIAAANIH